MRSSGCGNSGRVSDSGPRSGRYDCHNSCGTLSADSENRGTSLEVTMATSDDRLWRLHLRRSLGEVLTAGEQTDLAAWYAEQDQAETLALGLASNVDELSPLKQQVDAILGRIVATSLSIQTMANENETLRRENMALRHQLAQRRAFQPA